MRILNYKNESRKKGERKKKIGRKTGKEGEKKKKNFCGYIFILFFLSHLKGQYQTMNLSESTLVVIYTSFYQLNRCFLFSIVLFW